MREPRDDPRDALPGGVNRVPMGPGGEFDLIRRLIGREEALSPGVLLGSGDDCAVLDGGVVVSADLFVEGVHFQREWITLEEAGYRAASAALSDLAAMAAEPLGVLLTMALDPESSSSTAEEVQRGVAEACRPEGIQILGGDLASSPGPLMLSVVVLGRSGAPVLRAGTQVGDEIWVTGWLGGSGAAVALWKEGVSPPEELRRAFVRPRARIREALWLEERASLHGLIDLSDGLAGDAGHLAAAGGVAIVLREVSIPLHQGLGGLRGLSSRVGDPVGFSLTGGEDFELCFSVSPETLDEWVLPFQDAFGIPLTKVGWAGEGRGVFLEAAGGEVEPLERHGYNHFSVEEVE